MKTRCQHFVEGKGCGHTDYDPRKQKQTICPPNATESCYIREPEKPKTLFIWSRYTGEEKAKVDDAIQAVLNTSKKVMITVQEMKEWNQ